MNTLFRAAVLALCALAGAAATPAWAQGYPARPVRMIVPFAPGGPTDLVARIVAQKLGEAWGQQVIVDNKPGALSTIGADAAAKAPPDGYTLLLGTSTSNAASVSLFSKLPYDPAKDFAPISLIGLAPLVLVVHPALPVQSVKELIEMARSQPGKLNFAGGSSSAQAGGELFKALTGVSMVHVPYKGNAPGLADVMAGQVHLMFDAMNTALPQIKGGKVRALAVTSASRSGVAPELPTMAEAGVPGFELVPWLALYAPAGTPKDIVAKVAADTARLMKLPETAEKFRAQGIDPVGSTPEHLAAYQAAEIVKWAQLVKQANMKVE
jgi:tripartite-type tricarboxylate transporter receptor subunit TctC